MTRHSKNNTAGPVFTNYERSRAAHDSSWGSTVQRLNAESLRALNCCALTLLPCKHPVVTPQGVLFDKDAIIDYYFAQRDQIKASAATQAKESSVGATEQIEELKERTEFEALESGILRSKKARDSDADREQERKKRLKLDSNFWLPQNTPQVSESIQGTVSEIRCPISGAVLKLKKLVDCEFTTMNEDPERFMCPLSGKEITKGTPCVVLTTSGKVVSEQAFDAISKEDVVDPFNGKKIGKKDVIKLKREGTGHIGAGAFPAKSKKNPVFRA